MSEALQETEDGRCANCGEVPGPAFCGHCGQEVAARRGPLLAVVRELLADWLSLDGRLFRTLGLLVRPGRLTVRYLGGQRVTYLRPFRLYLLASVVLFSSLLSLRAPKAETVNLYIGGQLVTEAPAVQGRLNLSFFQNDSPIARWMSLREAATIAKLRQIPPQQLLDALFSGLRRVLPTAFILFVPFLALGLSILYFRSSKLYVDHLVFALHVQSALFLTLTIVWMICRLIEFNLFVSMLIYAFTGLAMLVVYLPWALHHVYREGRGWTALKSLLLIVIYSQMLALVTGAATYLVTTSLG